MLSYDEAARIMMSGGGNIQGLLTIYQNGVYVPGTTTGGDYYDINKDGVYEIDVQVSIPEYKTASLSVTAPKDGPITFDAHKQGLNGFDPVTVNPAQYNIRELTITNDNIGNAPFIAADWGCDGFDPVNVDITDRYDEGYADGYADGEEKGYIEGQDSIICKPIPGTPAEDILRYVENRTDVEVKQEGNDISVVTNEYPYTGREYPAGTSPWVHNSFYWCFEILVYKNGQLVAGHSKIRNDNMMGVAKWSINTENGQSHIYYTYGGGGEYDDSSYTLRPYVTGYLSGDGQVTVSSK